MTNTFDYDQTFRSGKSPLSSEYERLFAMLVPAEGKCNTVEGELLRASSKIYHDYYNNGFGNNWSGAYKFLDVHFGLKTSERKILHKYAKGKIAPRNDAQYSSDDKIAATLESLAERLMIAILDVERRGNGFTPNNEDMWDYTD